MDHHPTPGELDGLVFGGNSKLLRARERKKRQVLELLAAGGLEALANAPDGLQGVPLCEALLERSWALRHESPEQMVQLAHAATLAADRLTVAELSPTEILDLRCRAWTELGNAYRVNDELDRAEDALGRAAELLSLGSQEELLGARFYTAMASFWGARRHFESALTSFDIAINTYRRHGDEHLVGRTLIQKGIFTGYSGDAEEAVRLIQEGLTTVNEQRDPRLVFSSMQSKARFLMDCRRFQDARFVLWELRQSQLDPGGRVSELKVRWLEGQILSGLEKLEPAERALRQVKQGLEETGQAGLQYKAALAGLELGTVLLRRGRAREAEEVVIQCADVFRSLRIGRELTASVMVARKAAELQCLTLELLYQLIARLRREDR